VAQSIHEDPALSRFLDATEKDIASGRNVGNLPGRMLASMRRAMFLAAVDLEEPLTGDVTLPIVARSFAEQVR
jgi:hypothetical protein